MPQLTVGPRVCGSGRPLATSRETALRPVRRHRRTSTCHPCRHSRCLLALVCSLGNKLGGYYTVDPVHRGFEDREFVSTVRGSGPIPADFLSTTPNRTQERSAAWINDRQRKAAKKKVLAGGKYPQLCRLGEQLQRLCGENLLVIHCDRSLEESILSLQRRQKKQTRPRPSTPEAVEVLQRLALGGQARTPGPKSRPRGS